MKCVFLIFHSRKNHGGKPVSFEKDASSELVGYVFRTTPCIATWPQKRRLSLTGKLMCCNFLFREIPECQFERNLDVKLGHVLI